MNNRGFTLFEMKIAILIMAILATIMIPAVHSAKNKARITRAIAFERQLVDALDRQQTHTTSYVGPVVDIDFNDGLGMNKVSIDNNDTSDLIAGAQINNSDCIEGQCLIMDNEPQKLEFRFNANIPKIKNKFTAMAWVKFLDEPASAPNNEGIIWFIWAPWAPFIARFHDVPPASDAGTKLSAELQSNGLTRSMGRNITNGKSDMKTGVWQHVAMIYNGDTGVAALYLDGEKVDQIAIPIDDIDLTTGNGYIEIGQPDWKGRIDSVRIYYSAPDPADFSN